MIFSSVDLTPFSGGITAPLGGGFVYAWAVFRRTPVEVESVSVATLLKTLEYRDNEIARLRDRIAEQEDQIAELRDRVEVLENGS